MFSVRSIMDGNRMMKGEKRAPNIEWYTHGMVCFGALFDFSLSLALSIRVYACFHYSWSLDAYVTIVVFTIHKHRTTSTTTSHSLVYNGIAIGIGKHKNCQNERGKEVERREEKNVDLLFLSFRFGFVFDRKMEKFWVRLLVRLIPRYIYLSDRYFYVG